MSNQLNYANAGLRVLSFIIDALLLGILSWLLFGNNCSGGGFCVGYNNEETLIPLLYYVGFWIWRSATPGQMVLGLRVVDDGGHPITPKQAIIRAIVQSISAFVAGIGFIWILFDPKKQSWHDKAAKTFVISE